MWAGADYEQIAQRLAPVQDEVSARPARDVVVRGRPGREPWHLAETATPPTKAFLAAVDDDTRAAYRAAMIEHRERFRTPEGSVTEPRDYRLVLGTRR